MGRMQQFFYGRYGVDELTWGLFGLGLLFSLLARFTPAHFLILADYLLMIYMIYRILSRNIAQRRKENAAFLKVWNPVSVWASFRMQIFRERKQYRYFRCPSCKSYVRIPRGKGKVKITCRMCKHTFLKRT